MQVKAKIYPALALLLTAVLFMALLPVSVYAAEGTDWEWDEPNKTLTFYTDSGLEDLASGIVGIDRTATQIVIGAAVTSIHDSAFSSFNNLEDVTVAGNAPTLGGNNVFPAFLRNIYVDSNATGFTAANHWPEAKLRPSVLSNLVLSAGSIAFLNTQRQYSVTVPLETDSLTVTPTMPVGGIDDILVNGVNVSSGAESQAIALTANAITTIVVEIKSYGDDFYQTYTISVLRGTPPAPPPSVDTPHVCYFGDWQYSNEHHWKRCSCMALSDYAPHVFNSARVCTVCGYGATAKKVNPQTGVYDSGLPQSFSKPLLFHFAPLIGA